MNGVSELEERSYGTVYPGETAETFYVWSDGVPKPPWAHEYVVRIEDAEGETVFSQSYLWSDLESTGFNIVFQ